MKPCPPRVNVPLLTQVLPAAMSSAEDEPARLTWVGPNVVRVPVPAMVAGSDVTLNRPVTSMFAVPVSTPD
jgi:hypothetical protein